MSFSCYPDAYCYLYRLGLDSSFASLFHNFFTKFRIFMLAFLSFRANVHFYYMFVNIEGRAPILWRFLIWKFGLSMSYFAWAQQWGNMLRNTELCKAKIKHNYRDWYVCLTWYCFTIEMSMLQGQLGGYYYGEYPWSTLLGGICNRLFLLDLILIGKAALLWNSIMPSKNTEFFLLLMAFQQLYLQTINLVVMWDILLHFEFKGLEL